MDFGTLLHVAKQNSQNVKGSEGKYYSTKFSAPKKESKEKTLSDNIKKFLAKKEQEEREKARLERQKREQLMASRDEKAKNKIKKMLKVIKSANKSVLEDAVDTENTAVTLMGPEQPDEDDYGYVSQEASAFYAKYMDKVKTVTDDKKFAPSRPISKADLSGTKDRVRAAIMKEQEELNNPRSKKQSQIEAQKSESSSKNDYGRSSSDNGRSSSSMDNAPSRRKKNLYDPETERREEEERKRREEEERRKKNKKAAPPALDFNALLKLAEQKQHEPLEVVVETKKEPERLLTKKEKREMEERRAYLESRDKKKRVANDIPNKMQPNGKIPKLNGATQSSQSPIEQKKPSSLIDKSPKPQSLSSARDNFKKPNSVSASSIKNGYSSSGNSSSKGAPQPSSQLKGKSSSTPAGSTGLTSKSSSLSLSSSLQKNVPMNKSSSSLNHSSSSTLNGAKRPDPKNPLVRRDVPIKDNGMRKSDVGRSSNGEIKPKRPMEVPERARQFPPLDVMRTKKQDKKPMKRRILDDDDDEYDSELDDFIDDGPSGEYDNYSAHIKEIFGYDKSRYRDEDFDDAAMESSFAQQMREEFISKKMGLLEDLEDMKKEEEEKKKKALMKKKMKIR
uniref:Protein SPT2 homolog n=1 Tax=Tabanus bromius TaxID=304241 RepID=A0A0K8TMB8_TABBR